MPAHQSRCQVGLYAERELPRAEARQPGLCAAHMRRASIKQLQHPLATIVANTCIGRHQKERLEQRRAPPRAGAASAAARRTEPQRKDSMDGFALSFGRTGSLYTVSGIVETGKLRYSAVSAHLHRILKQTREQQP